MQKRHKEIEFFFLHFKDKHHYELGWSLLLIKKKLQQKKGKQKQIIQGHGHILNTRKTKYRKKPCRFIRFFFFNICRERERKRLA